MLVRCGWVLAALLRLEAEAFSGRCCTPHRGPITGIPPRGPSGYWHTSMRSEWLLRVVGAAGKVNQDLAVTIHGDGITWPHDASAMPALELSRALAPRRSSAFPLVDPHFVFAFEKRNQGRTTTHTTNENTKCQVDNAVLM